jgi:hypothetical protein
MDRRTNHIFQKLEPHFREFVKHSRKTGVPLDLALAVAFVELQQYGLHNAVTALKVLKNKVCKIRAFNNVIGQLLPPVSVGLCHIKKMTAFRAVYWSNGHLDPGDIEEMANDETASIRVLFGVLLAHRNRWKDFFDIGRRPDVWATLFNICDFDRITPHTKPKPGGSELPLWIDGGLVDLPFGCRVVVVMASGDMFEFLEKMNTLN